MTLAYIDPGSGSILVQVILASCIGGVAIFWSKIKALFAGKKTEPKDSEKTADKAEESPTSPKPE